MLRLLLHRRLTRKRGYGRLHLTLASRDGKDAPRQWKKGKPPPQERPGSFVGEFALAACAATAVHGLLLWLVVGKLWERSPDGDDLRLGVLGVAAFQLLAFAFDLRGLRERSFAWIREQAEAALNRVTLVHLALIVGAWAGLRSGMVAFFGPFTVIKALSDVGNALHRVGLRVDGERVPRWLDRAMSKVGPDGATFADYWRELKEEQRRLARQDEEAQAARRG